MIEAVRELNTPLRIPRNATNIENDKAAMNKKDEFVGFPEIIPEQELELTRPMPLHERPRKVRIEHEMAIIRAHHERIAKIINVFWGHKECVEYLQQLILNGDDGDGKARVGFKREVLSALINLVALHEEVVSS